MDIKKYFSPNGTIIRSEYWGTLILSVAVAIALAFAYGVVAGLNSTSDGFDNVVTSLIGLANLWIWIAATMKRCRDADINVWFTLLMCIPYISFIAIIVFGCLPSVNKGE